MNFSELTLEQLFVRCRNNCYNAILKKFTDEESARFLPIFRQVEKYAKGVINKQMWVFVETFQGFA